MRLFSRLTLPLVVSLGLAAPASAAPFCAGLPEWANQPCSAAIGWLTPWFPGGDQGPALPALLFELLPHGGMTDPDGREPPPPPPAPALAPADSPSDSH